MNRNLLPEGDADDQQTINRRIVLNEGGFGPRRWYANPRIWALIVGVVIVVGVIIAIALVFSLTKNGKNATQVKKIIEASKTADIGFQRLTYVLL